MPVSLYMSTDAGAPSLTNTAGALISVFDACLVNGYGAKAAAGWVKSYSSSTTGASYRQGTGSNQLYLNVDDSQPNYARGRGYEEMTAYNTGTGLFPIDAQQSGGVFIHKTNNVAGTRPWVLLANEKIFYFITQFDTTTSFGQASWFAFGDIIPEKTVDPWDTILMGATGSGQTTDAANAGSTSAAPYFSFVSHTLGGHWTARSHTAVGGSTAIGKHINFARLGHSTNGSWLNSYAYTMGGGSGRLTYPNPANGAMYTSPIWIHELNLVRGRMPGVYVNLGNPHLTNFDTYTGAGDLAGKTFLAVNIWNSQLHLETSNTW